MTLTAALVAQTFGALALITLVALIGTRVFRSAAATDTHLKAAAAFAVRPSIAESGGAREAHAAPPAADAPGADSALQISGQLDAYYAANISQSTTIFWASLLAMAVGFAIVFIGVIAAGSNGVTAIVAAIAGVLGQFIGATFLIALRSTQQQATTFAQTLVELRMRDLARAAEDRSIALGLQLLSEISADRNDPANPTKAAIATGLIVKQQPAVIEAPPVSIGVPSGEPVERRTRSGIVTFGETNVAQTP